MKTFKIFIFLMHLQISQVFDEAFDKDANAFEQTSKLPIFGQTNQVDKQYQKKTQKMLKNVNKNMFDIKQLTELNFMMDQFKVDMEGMSEQFRESRYFFKMLYREIMKNMTYRGEESEQSEELKCVQEQPKKTKKTKKIKAKVIKQKQQVKVQNYIQQKEPKKEEVYFVGDEQGTYDFPVWSIDTPQVSFGSAETYGF